MTKEEWEMLWQLANSQMERVPESLMPNQLPPARVDLLGVHDGKVYVGQFEGEKCRFERVFFWPFNDKLIFTEIEYTGHYFRQPIDPDDPQPDHIIVKE